MAELKVGDKVRRIDAGGGAKNIPMGSPLIVKSVRDSYTGNLVSVQGYGGEIFDYRFELISLTPEEEAIALLTKAGYTIGNDGTISPPKPKLGGEVVIYHRKTNPTLIYTCTIDTWNNYNGTIYTQLAVVPWTEGDGLGGLQDATEPDGSF